MGIKEKGRQETPLNILILGIDGYIGWPLANHLKGLGHTVTGIDNFSRRYRVERCGSRSLIPISTIPQRQKLFDIKDNTLHFVNSFSNDVDVIIHLAEQPSAPWSMVDRQQAATTQRQNVLGTLNVLWLMREFCPDAHLIKLGSMGEYGTPGCDIPEGFIPKDCLYDDRDPHACSFNRLKTPTLSCPMQGLPFPKSPGSFYHLSKVHDTHNVKFACDIWGLKATDVLQGIVFGVMDDTRFDYDEHFGTVINRFCTQAVAGIPLTVYGSGGQTRGYLPLRDSIECLTLAIDNPPKNGEYRVFNQFATTYTVNDIARKVCFANHRDSNVWYKNIENPRIEQEGHYYNPKCEKLRVLGYNPKWNLVEELAGILKTIRPHKDRIIKDVIYPKTRWK